MSSNLPTIDISNSPELIRLAEEVITTGEDRILNRNGKPMVVVKPVSLVKKVKKKNTTAFLASLGTWKDIDIDTMIKNIYKAREKGSRSTSRP